MNDYNLTPREAINALALSSRFMRVLAETAEELSVDGMRAWLIQAQAVRNLTKSMDKCLSEFNSEFPDEKNEN